MVGVQNLAGLTLLSAVISSCFLAPLSGMVGWESPAHMNPKWDLEGENDTDSVDPNDSAVFSEQGLSLPRPAPPPTVQKRLLATLCSQ